MQIPSREHYEGLKAHISAPDMTWEHYQSLAYVMSDEAMRDLREALAAENPQPEVKVPAWATNLCMICLFGIPVTLVTLVPFIGFEAWGYIALTLTSIFFTSTVLAFVFTKRAD